MTNKAPKGAKNFAEYIANRGLKKKAYQKLYKKQRIISFIYILNTICWMVVAIRGINIQCYINPVFANTIQESIQENIQENIQEETEEETPTIPYYKVTAEERELLAKLLWAEGRGEDYDCKKGIVSVVMNRVASSQFPNTISGVVYQKGQFEPVSNGQLNRATPFKQIYDAVDEVINYGSTMPEWVLYFRADHHFGWEGYTGFLKMSNTYFGGYEK